MALGRDRWVEVTPSRFPHERNGLEYVRAALPDQDPYRAWTGVEIITDRGRSLDVDALGARLAERPILVGSQEDRVAAMSSVPYISRTS